LGTGTLVEFAILDDCAGWAAPFAGALGVAAAGAGCGEAWGVTAEVDPAGSPLGVVDEPGFFPQGPKRITSTIAIAIAAIAVAAASHPVALRDLGVSSWSALSFARSRGEMYSEAASRVTPVASLLSDSRAAASAISGSVRCRGGDASWRYSGRSMGGTTVATGISGGRVGSAGME
jgi:hypothetical protein